MVCILQSCVSLVASKIGKKLHEHSADMELTLLDNNIHN